MTYPYYYPYYSARNVIPAPFHNLASALQSYSRLQEEQAEIDLAVRLKQEQIAAQRIRQYQKELKQKLKHYQQSYSSPIQADHSNTLRNPLGKEQADTARRTDYSRNVVRYQNLSPSIQPYNHSQKPIKQQNIIYIDDAYYDRRVQQYQQQLLQKIQRTNKEPIIKATNANNKSTKKNKIYKNNTNQSKRIAANDTEQPEQNIIINKKPKRNKPQSTFRNPLVEIRTNSLKNDHSCRYQTIDVHQLRPKISNIFNHSDAKRNTVSLYQTQKKSRPHSKNKSNSFIHCKRDTLLNQRAQAKEQKPKGDSLSSMALRKIDNRLKLSSIVFKDSKWPNERHLINHLMNTYENEEKGRKEIKDRINNNPKILKKHALVPSSR